MKDITDAREEDLLSREKTLVALILLNSGDLGARRQLIRTRGELSRRRREEEAKHRAITPHVLLYGRFKPDTVWSPLDDEMVAATIPDEL